VLMMVYHNHNIGSIVSNVVSTTLELLPPLSEPFTAIMPLPTVEPFAVMFVKDTVNSYMLDVLLILTIYFTIHPTVCNLVNIFCFNITIQQRILTLTLPHEP
jgi:hypothetical protein